MSSMFVPASRPDSHHFDLRRVYAPVNKREVKLEDSHEVEETQKEEPQQSELLPTPPYQLVQRARVQALLKWNSPSGVGCGLVNKGNTCFINSVMQCLAYTPPLMNFLASQEHARKCRLQGFCALCSFGRLALEMHKRKGAVVPDKFLANLRRIAPTMHFGRQEDSHEWLRYLLDAMQNVLEKEAVGQGNSKLPPGVAETSWIFRIFGGYILNQLKCLTCGYMSKRADPMMDLSLEITGCPTLVHCFRKFTCEEKLEGDNAWKCDPCNAKRSAHKQMKILQPPEILTVQLKRFTPLGKKRDKFVQFGTELDLSEFVVDEHKGRVKYSLFALLVHEGATTKVGHYTAFVKAPNDVWYLMDDGSVSRASLEAKVLKENPYLLFYVRTYPKQATSVPRNLTLGTGKKDNEKGNGMQSKKRLREGQDAKKQEEEEQQEAGLVAKQQKKEEDETEDRRKSKKQKKKERKRQKREEKKKRKEEEAQKKKEEEGAQEEGKEKEVSEKPNESVNKAVSAVLEEVKRNMSVPEKKASSRTASAISGTKTQINFETFMARSQSEADVLAWDQSDPEVKKQKFREAQASEERHHRAKFDPLLDRGRVKKVKKAKTEVVSSSGANAGAFEKVSQLRRKFKMEQRDGRMGKKQLVEAVKRWKKKK